MRKIMFAISQSSLGFLLVAKTEKGICSLTMDDNKDKLLTCLRTTFSDTKFIEADQAFMKDIALIVSLIEKPTSVYELPLDVSGTAFQLKVWEALKHISIGTTASYLDIAKRIGAPKSVRAVARACASNLISILIPCHRVVKSNGSLSGYRWGIKRKALLLEREGVIISA